MRVHWLQHVEFEGLGNIKDWVEERDYSLTKTAFYNPDYILPKNDDYDFLIIMGGPMSTSEEEIYPFLKEEKLFIKQALENGKVVLGICLGSQLISDVLGGRVYKNVFKEIGWYPVKFNAKNVDSPFTVFEKTEIVFHWHGDTFTLPENAEWIAESEGCRHQAFEYNDGKVAALQFHIEMTEESINNIIDKCGEEIKEDKYISTAEEIKKGNGNVIKNRESLFRFLDKMVAPKLENHIFAL